MESRLHGLDALRAFALLLGVALHASMAYLAGDPFWIITDFSRSAGLGLTVYVVHMFRMMVFFILAGYFARMGCERLGRRGFARDRLKRIALPLVLAWPLVMVTVVAGLVAAAIITKKLGLPVPAHTPAPPTFTPTSFPLAHLWFLYVLLMFYGAAIVLARLAGDRANALLDRLATLAATPAALLLALPLAGTLLRLEHWMQWGGIPTPDQSLLPNLPALVGYGGGFALGWLAHRKQAILQAWQARWPHYLGLAIIATLACLWSGKPDLVNIISYSIATYSWSIALIGFALQRLNAAKPALRYMADASYWIYIVHLPLVLALQVALAPLTWPWQAKLTLLLAVASLLLFGSYHLMVRRTIIGALLNGRRKP